MKKLYAGRIVDLNLEDVRLPDGRTTQLEIIRHSGAAAAVPLREDGRVVLIRQFRYAAAGLIFEVPAGRLESGEKALDCARREMAEEVGQTAGRWDHLGNIWTTPGFTDEKIHLFLARDLTVVRRSPEDDEVIEVVEVPLDESMEMIRRGEICDGKTICALTLAWFRLRDEAGKTPKNFSAKNFSG